MSTATRTAATLEDLYRVEGKAELIDGRIIQHMATGFSPSRVASRIYKSLDDYAESVGTGVALNDAIGYAIPMLASRRQSFSPDASYFLGKAVKGDMRFLEGPPQFAVEVRSENDYGDLAEAAQAAKRADYFEAGTPVVWDVDPINERICKYTSNAPETPTTFTPGQKAHAEPAVPGWSIAVDQIFK